MEQIINLSSTENTQFQRFIFGFTSQTASGDNQRSLIRDLKLSFVRSTDPTVTCDPNESSQDHPGKVTHLSNGEMTGPLHTPRRQDAWVLRPACASTRSH